MEARASRAVLILPLLLVPPSLRATTRTVLARQPRLVPTSLRHLHLPNLRGITQTTLPHHPRLLLTNPKTEALPRRQLIHPFPLPSHPRYVTYSFGCI
jgi:hypothetical protein